ncbi:hypothetical protein SCHPADRAFT_826848 [Schizopora paradoxa]|uniref:L-ornithine N(5)-monooxygenase [NAD(P)H] n=1 Tax=Schizopora paradoxa TaxID=27342 RepID=A0A0H2SBB1_9AGAM|nr:hypothetical protein SCHPADRAFT_826848 [Schizopora paradoxa]
MDPSRLDTLHSMEGAQDKVFDVLGCGFGPANLAIAVALAERWTEAKNPIEQVVFVEKYSEFSWHPGMLIPGAQMQISCLKDLATLRNPNSKYTFLSYLHSQGRLLNFINRGTMIPPRREFADYLSWAAEKVQRDGVQVAYAEEVVGINKSDKNDIGETLYVVTSRRTADGGIVSRLARHLIISPGGSPRVPACLSFALVKQPEAPIIHTSSYMLRIEDLLSRLSRRPTTLKLAIVGSGQSASEVLLDLHSRLQSIAVGETGSQHELHLIMRNGSFKPSDDSPFVNEIFNPEATGHIYSLPSSQARKSVLGEYRNTNYGVISPKTMDAIFEIIYEQQVSDGIASRTSKCSSKAIPRVFLRKYQTVVEGKVEPAASDERNMISLMTQHVHTRDIAEESYDAVFCGTGYDRTSWQRLLRASNFGKEYGLTDDSRVDSRKVTLEPAAEDEALFEFSEDAHENESNAETTSGTESSDGSLSTPPSSENLSLTVARPPVLRISRNYRLLSMKQHVKDSSRNKIYLQGCVEATHGLSDSLLSVLGVRAGEVVGDIFQKN